MTVPPETSSVGGCHVGLPTSTYVCISYRYMNHFSICKRFVIHFWYSQQNTVQFASFAGFYYYYFKILANCRFIGLAGAWEALFAYDSIIFSLIMYKTWKVRRDYAVTGIEIPLISLILRDGEMSFEISPNS